MAYRLGQVLVECDVEDNPALKNHVFLLLRKVLPLQIQHVTTWLTARHQACNTPRCMDRFNTVLG
jgi:hypothetical protein